MGRTYAYHVMKVIENYKIDTEDCTPVHTSGTYPIFRQAAEELAQQLEKIGGPDHLLMAGEMRWFADEFSSWNPQNRPDDATRTRLISEFMTAFRTLKERALKDSAPPRY